MRRFFIRARTASARGVPGGPPRKSPRRNTRGRNPRGGAAPGADRRRDTLPAAFPGAIASRGTCRRDPGPPAGAARGRRAPAVAPHRAPTTRRDRPPGTPEGLLSPGHLAGRADGREGGDAAETSRMPQRQRECAMAAHGMAADAGVLHVEREVRGQHARQFLRDPALHAPMPRIGLRGGIEVEARAVPEVPVLVRPGHARSARARVRRDQRDAEARRVLLRARLDREGLLVAGEASQVPQHRHAPALRGLRRQVHAEPHGQADGLRCVLVEALGAAEARMRLQRGDALHVSTPPRSGSIRRPSSGRSPC